MTNKKKRRLGTDVPESFYNEFKNNAIRIFGWKKGYTKKSVISAFKWYLWLSKELMKYNRELIYIGNRDYGDIEDKTERRKKMFQDAVEEFVLRRLQDKEMCLIFASSFFLSLFLKEII
jgi:hypothetical protein